MFMMPGANARMQAIQQLQEQQGQGQGQAQPQAQAPMPQQMIQPQAPQQAPAHPLSYGSREAMRQVKESMGMDEHERRRAFGMALSHLGRGIFNPRYKDALGGAAESMPDAMNAYMQEESRVQQMNANILERLRQEEMEKHRREQEERRFQEVQRHHRASEGGHGGRAGNPYYGMPALGKLIRQQHEIEAGWLPGSNGQIPLTPEQQEEYLNENKLARIKLGSDSSNRTRSLFAKNLQQTIDSTNVDDLTSYSGAKGAVSLKKEQALDPFGKSSEQYKKYEEAQTNALLEAQEMRQFLGSSITPSQVETLEMMTNPSGFGVSAEVAKRKINALRNTIKKQMGTYQESLVKPEAYGHGRKSEKSPVIKSESKKDMDFNMENVVKNQPKLMDYDPDLVGEAMGELDNEYSKPYSEE